MRSALLIGLVMALLIVGILVIKNMGRNSTGDVVGTEAGRVIERAEDTKDQVGRKVRDIQKSLKRSE